MTTTMKILTLYLTPRDVKAKPTDSIKGGNTRLADSAQYTKQIPKPARKEFEKGVRFDKNGKSDEAIDRYQKAIEIWRLISTKRAITSDQTYWRSRDLPKPKSSSSK